ncbi:hypothetical protein EON67_02755 [archaeon]|nr:MAG: hypothetical protein EON67_02755 [archaeon]
MLVAQAAELLVCGDSVRARPRACARVPRSPCAYTWLCRRACSIAPFALADRRRKRGMDRRIVEVSAALKQCFETVIDTKLYPQSRIDISIYVLQSDGNPVSGAHTLHHAAACMREYAPPCVAVAACWRARVCGRCGAYARTLARLLARLAAAINAGTLALMDAGIAMFDFLVSCSAVFIQRVALVGLCVRVRARAR